MKKYKVTGIPQRSSREAGGYVLEEMHEGGNIPHHNHPHEGDPPDKKPLFVIDENDPRLQGFQDSLSLYNQGAKDRLTWQTYGSRAASGPYWRKTVEEELPEGYVVPNQKIQPTGRKITRAAFPKWMYPDGSGKGGSELYKSIQDTYTKPQQPVFLGDETNPDYIKYIQDEEKAALKQEIIDKQQQLIDAGFKIGKADGIWGSKSKAAWAKFVNKEDVLNLPISTIPAYSIDEVEDIPEEIEEEPEVEIHRLPITKPTLTTDNNLEIIGDYDEPEELVRPDYSNYQGIEQVRDRFNPKRRKGAHKMRQRISARIAQALTGYDAEKMDAEIEAADKEGRRINFENMGLGAVSNKKFRKKYNEEYDKYEEGLKEQEYLKAVPRFFKDGGPYIGAVPKYAPGGAYGPGDGIKKFLRKAKDNTWLTANYGKLNTNATNYVPTIGLNTIMGSPKKGFHDFNTNIGGDKGGLAANLKYQYYGPFMSGQRNFQGSAGAEAYYDQDKYGAQFFAGPNIPLGSSAKHRDDELRRGSFRFDIMPNLKVGMWDQIGDTEIKYYQPAPNQPIISTEVPKGAKLDWGYGLDVKGEYKFPKIPLSLFGRASYQADLVRDSTSSGAQYTPADMVWVDSDNPDQISGQFGPDGQTYTLGPDYVGGNEVINSSKDEGWKTDNKFNFTLGARYNLDNLRFNPKNKSKRKIKQLEENDPFYNPGVRNSQGSLEGVNEELDEQKYGGPHDPPEFKEFLGEEPGTFTTENFQDKDGYNLDLVYPKTNMKRRPTRFGYDDYDKGFTEITKGDDDYIGIKKELKPIVKQEFKDQKLKKRFPREEYYTGNKTYKPSQEFLDQVDYQATHKGENKMGDTDVLVNMIYDDLNLQGFDIGTNTGTRKQRKLAQRLEHSPAWYAANALKERDALGVSMPKQKYGGYVLEELENGGENDIVRPHGDSYEYKTVNGKYYTRKREGEWESEGQPGWDLAGGDAEASIKNKVYKIGQIQELMDRDGVHPLDLVYGNKELGIPKMGTLEGMSGIAELQDYFFDPNKDMMDTYIEQRGDPKEREAATKRKRENYLNNVQRTEAEDQAYEEKIRVEEEIASAKAYEEECKDPMSECYKRNAQRWYQASRDYDDSGQFVRDMGSMIGDQFAELTYKPVVRTAKKAYNDPLGLVSDLSTTASDIQKLPFRLAKETYDYGFGDGNFEGSKLFDMDALGTSVDALSVAPFAGGATKLVKPITKLVNPLVKTTKPLISKADDLLRFTKGAKPRAAYKVQTTSGIKPTGGKTPLSKTEIDEIIKERKAYWNSDEYTKRRTAQTGETKEQVAKAVKEYSDDLDNTTINFNDKLDDAGLYTPKGKNSIIHRALGEPKYTNPQIDISLDGSSTERLKNILTHEIDHLGSPLLRENQSFKYPTLKSTGNTGRNRYFNLVEEQQAARNQVDRTIRQDLGIDNFDPLTENQVTQWSQSNPGRQRLMRPEELGFDHADDLLSGMRDAGNSKKDVLNFLNKGYVTIPAAGGVGYGLMNGQDASQIGYKHGGFIEAKLTDEEVEQYKAGGYILEELEEGGEDDIVRPHGDPYEYKKVGDKYYTRKTEGEWNQEYAEGDGPKWNLASGEPEDAIKYNVFKEEKPEPVVETKTAYDPNDPKNFDSRYHNDFILDQDIDNTANNYYQVPTLNLNGIDPDAEYNAWVAAKPQYTRAPSWLDENVFEPVGDLYDKFQKTSLGPIDDATNFVNDMFVQPIVDLATDTYNDPNKVAGEVMQMMVDAGTLPFDATKEAIRTNIVNPDAEFDTSVLGDPKSLERFGQIAAVVPAIPNVFGKAAKTTAVTNKVDDVVNVTNKTKKTISRPKANTTTAMAETSSGNVVDVNDLQKVKNSSYMKGSDGKTYLRESEYNNFTGTRKANLDKKIANGEVEVLRQTPDGNAYLLSDKSIANIDKTIKTKLDRMKTDKGRQLTFEQEKAYIKKEFPEMDEASINQAANQAVDARIAEVESLYKNKNYQEAYYDLEEMNAHMEIGDDVITSTQYQPEQVANFDKTVNPVNQNANMRFHPGLADDAAVVSHEGAHITAPGRNLPIEDEILNAVGSPKNLSAQDQVAYDYLVATSKKRKKLINDMRNHDPANANLSEAELIDKYSNLGQSKGDIFTADYTFGNDIKKVQQLSSEVLPYAQELKQVLLDRGLIDDWFQEITPDILAKAKQTISQEPAGFYTADMLGNVENATSTTRLLDITDPSRYEQLSNSLNKIAPVAVPAAAVGTGTMMNEQDGGFIERELTLEQVKQYRLDGYMVEKVQ